MTDRELLELAAKAAGFESKWDQPRGASHGRLRIKMGDLWPAWHPLSDDGDALRLAIDLQITFGVVLEDSRGWAESRASYIEFEWGMSKQSERYEATRRAIVRAAAAIGAQMP